MNTTKNTSYEFAVQTYGLTKDFGELKAVKSLDLKIRQGEIFSLLGTNGAGKTTTIKMLCCLLKPTSGSAEVLGHNIKDHPEKIKAITGISPQETSIAGHLSTQENLLLMGGIFGLKKKESKKRADELTDLMDLNERKRDQSRKLSGGMQRRLSIAMALMSDPKILYLDEPTLGLDPFARRSVWNYIEKLKGKKTILLTTHYLEEADILADNIAIMDDAEIIETGSSEELKKKYNSIQILSVTADQIPKNVAFKIINQDMEVFKTKKGIDIKAKEIDFYAVTEILKSSNVKITGLQMHEPTLDDVFLKLTGKEALL